MIKIDIDKVSQGIEQSEAREVLGLNPLDFKTRKCLKCNRSFESIGNRLCPSCNNENNEYVSGYI